MSSITITNYYCDKCKMLLGQKQQHCVKVVIEIKSNTGNHIKSTTNAPPTHDICNECFVAFQNTADKLLSFLTKNLST